MDIIHRHLKKCSLNSNKDFLDISQKSLTVIISEENTEIFKIKIRK